MCSRNILHQYISIETINNKLYKNSSEQSSLFCEIFLFFVQNNLLNFFLFISFISIHIFLQLISKKRVGSVEQLCRPSIKFSRFTNLYILCLFSFCFQQRRIFPWQVRWMEKFSSPQFKFKRMFRESE